MTARVLELGGDTLLFGERGRPGRVNVPPEIVKRRNELLAVAQANRAQQPAAQTATDHASASLEEPLDLGAGGGQTGTPKISVDQAPVAQGELWYYGAALRCKD
jgi:hypothetical protein